MVVYGPTKEDAEEREKFWNDLDRVADRVSNGYKLCVLGDLNGWFGECVDSCLVGLLHTVNECI